MKWAEMTPRERDAAMAGVIQGWQELWGATDAAQIPIPLFTTSHYGAHQAEDEIERRGLQDAYTEALIGLVSFDAEQVTQYMYLTSISGIWSLIRATPEQKCHTAWRAMGGE